jgi:hypothetical protein
MSTATGWRNRIVRTGMAPLDQITFNARNWRIHPKPQQDALAGVLSEVGVVQHVIINERTGNLVDGHLRVTLADRAGEPAVPAVFVDLSEDEEALILATLDPLSAMAATDREQLDALLHEVSTGDAAVQAMLDQLAAQAGLVPPVDPMAEWQGMPAFEQPDHMPHRTLKVHFEDDDAVADFSQLIGQKLSPETQYVWHPEQKPQARGQYMSDES